MKIRADVKCHTCGFVSGEVVGEAIGASSSRIKPERFRRSALCPAPWPIPGQPVRCGRCNGSVYLDEIDVVTEQRLAA